MPSLDQGSCRYNQSISFLWELINLDIMLQPTRPVLLTVVVIAAGFAAAQSNINITDPGYNCTPDLSCWPTKSAWAEFNSTVGGSLHATVPFAAPCYPSSEHHDAARCEVVQDGYTNSTIRSAVYGATQELNWETCGDTGCTLQSLLPQLPRISQTCSLGRLGAYFVDARNADHVVEAINFARIHNLRLTIKNTGHDYFGRDMVPNSLAIWTRHIDNMVYHSSFTAHNCPSANGQNIGEIGAGVEARAAYTFFEEYQMNVVGGNEGSVGLAGGFGQGGGHGMFGPSYGLMVDNAVEFDVVTADGEKRTINQCNDPDLFWAMRGGGGGTYAVLINYRFQLYLAVPINLYTFRANFSVLDEAATLRDILTAHADSQTNWSNNNVSGHAYYFPGKMELFLVLPYDDDGSRLKELTAYFRNYVTAYPGIDIAEDQYYSYPKYTDFLALTQSLADRLTPSGWYAALAARLLPRDLFVPQNVSSLVSAVISGLNQNQNFINHLASIPTEIIMTTPANHPDGSATAANPVWRNALWHLVYAGGWTDGIPTSTQRSITETLLKSLDPVKALTPGGGCYMNEGHYLEPDWQQTFFGSNYDRLLRIKNRHDPTHLFDCWKCVGWRGAEE